jgi:protein PsiE
VAQLQKIETLDQKIKSHLDVIGNVLVDGFHYFALFAIGGSIVWSAVFAYIGMVSKGQASIDDILLLFIYLEFGAMVGIYFKTSHMPVRFLLYVGVTALIRMLVVTHEPDRGILFISGAILLLAIATLVFRYGSAKLPSVKPRSDSAPKDKLPT